MRRRRRGVVLVGAGSFPCVAERIAWGEVPEHLQIDVSQERAARRTQEEDAVIFSDCVGRAMGRLAAFGVRLDEEPAILWGSDDDDHALELSPRQFREHAAALFSYGLGHCYGVGSSGDWCIVMEHEGFLCAGVSPGRFVWRRERQLRGGR